jgi:hypothetical protein
MKKKSYSFRLDEKFVEALDKRANLERISRTQMFEKIGWQYLRWLFKQDNRHLEDFNRAFNRLT